MNNKKYSYTELINNGLSKYKINQMVCEESIYKLSRGIYSYENELDDTFYINQKDNKYFVYSNETAAYFHELTNRFPVVKNVTTKQGYHLRSKDLKIFYVKEDVLDLGIEKIIDNSGNEIVVYDTERTICDLIKNENRVDEQVYIESLQNYFLKQKPNFNKIYNYAEKLNIVKKVNSVCKLYTKS